MLLPLDKLVLAHMLTQMVLFKLQLGLKLQDLNQLAQYMYKWYLQ